MRKTKFQRVTAFALALVFLLGGVFSVGTSAAGGSTYAVQGSANQKYNALTYKEYLAQSTDVPRADKEVVLYDAETVKGYLFTPDGNNYYNEEGFAYNTNGVADPYANDPDSDKLAGIREYDGKNALYTPGTGTVTWTTEEIKNTAKYSLLIEYYPVKNLSNPIERRFTLNGTVPFSESRYLTIAKRWINVYADGAFALPEGESADTYMAKAAQMGITAYTENRTDGVYIVYKMPEYWTKDVSALVDDQTVRFFTEDIDKNEIRASLAQAPEWNTYEFRDSNGFYQESFEFVVTPENGKVSVSLEGVNEPLAIKSVKLVPHKDNISYADYIKKYQNAPEGADKIKIEAEYFSASSSQTVYPLEDRTSAITSPSATDRTVLNTIGGEKWQTVGQWVTYQFEVGSSGLYEIAARYRQALLDGMFVSRALYIYSDSTVSEGEDGYYNGLPFAEAANLRFGYSSDWQSGALNDGQDGHLDGFKFYFKEGVVYTIKIEVALGAMGDIINTVQNSLDAINNDYLAFIKLTGSSPDEYRDYGFNRIMPDTMIDLIIQSRTLESVSSSLAEIAGDKSSMTATLSDIARLLNKMGTNEDEVAKSLEELKTDIGSLGTWLGDAKTQPLVLDFISIQGESQELPVAKANFWQSMIYELSRFIKSFFRNYDRMGTIVEPEDGESVEVWLAYGRDQSQVLRGLINNDFSSNTDIPVDLKLVSAGTLLPSILAGKGPDVYIGLGQADVINYAIRGALLPVDDCKDFDKTITQFNEAAMIVLGIENSKGEYHYYGLPETQAFNMMFVRDDILADLGLQIPKTWDDLLEAIPVLQANNMMIGMHTDYKVFLYQKDGELFADNGMRINLDSNLALEAFNTMCNMFTMYSFPYQFDFANRFRTGEMPIGFAGYTAAYNQLKVFATEIEGLWSFHPMPGYIKDGKLNNVSVSGLAAVVMITDCEDKAAAWEFMKWYTGTQCQTDYANEMIALIGPSAKHATANSEALKSMGWTAAELEPLLEQFNNLAAIPNYPGSYIIDRYTNFAFLAAYNEGADPVTELQTYITTINKEITRKRAEFELETLDYVGQTLAEKRMGQALDALEAAKENAAYNNSYNGVYERAVAAIDEGNTEDYASLRSAAIALNEANAELFAEAVKYLNSAATALESYEAYK